MHENRLVIVFKVNGVRKSLNKNAAKGIKANWVVGRGFSNQLVGPLKISKKIIAQAARLLVMPLKGISRVNHGLR